MKSLLLFAIVFYQRHLSARKGFCCAYRHHAGHASCSLLGLRAVRRFGIVGGLRMLKRRLYLCGVASRRYAPLRPHRYQRGDCDPGCDLPCEGGCELPGMQSCQPLEILDCADVCGCGGSKNNRKESSKEAAVYIPPPIDRRT